LGNGLGGDGVNDLQPSGVVGAGEAANPPIHTLAIAVLGVPLVDNAYLERCRTRSGQPQAVGISDDRAVHARSRRNGDFVQRLDLL
jgi:hypothetical protein